jgi:hypothetical protein
MTYERETELYLHLQERKSLWEYWLWDRGQE